MKLTKHPETELEYWMAIEGLGGFRHSMEHGLAHDRIEDKGGGVATEVASAVELQTQLVRELREKFGVFDPRMEPDYDPENPPPTPEGMTLYWDWYDWMKKEWSQKVYESIICSACPFSEGAEAIERMQIVPCGAINGTIYHLSHPSECGETSFGNWSHENLYGKVLKEAGVEGLRVFIAKELELEGTEPDQNFVL